MRTDGADPRDRDVWKGDIYELAMAFAPLDADALARVLGAVEEFADLRTPKHGGTRGYVTRLPHGKRIVCRMMAAPIDDSGQFVGLYFPVEALARVDRRVGEFLHSYGQELEWTDHLRDWFRALDDWLAEVALRVHEVMPMLGGRIGWEHPVGDYVVTGRPPAKRSRALLVVRDGRVEYLPANAR